MCRFVRVVIVAGILAVGMIAANADEKVLYSKQITPILRTYCLGCHSRAEAQGGLSMQSVDDLLKGGEHGAVLDPAMPSSSRIAAVLTSTGDDHMPPADQPQPSTDDIALLQRWLREGATFDSRATVMPVLPNVKPRTETVRLPATAMQVSRDGSKVLIGRHKLVELRSADLVSQLWSAVVPDGKVYDVRFSADEQRVLVATGIAGLSGRAVEFQIGSAEQAREFGGHGDQLYAATWSPDGSIVATAGYDRRIVLHDANSGAVLREMTGHNGAIFDLDFSPDGALLGSASADATIKIWNVATGERFDTLGQPQSEQYAVCFSPDGRFVFGAGADSRIRQWQLVSKSGPEINPITISRFAHEGVISSLEISSDGTRLVSAAESGTVKIWDAGTVQELVAETVPAGIVVTSIATDDAGRRAILGLSDATIHPIAMTASGPESEAASLVHVETPMSDGVAIELAAIDEVEPNHEIAAAQSVNYPALIKGVIHRDDSTSDSDCFKFDAKKDQTVLLEVKAGRNSSPLDSVVEVLTTDGQPVLQVQLQAVRDSYFTFRGKDADTSDDFRVFNWQEMELNEYLYADGEVVKLWLYPRGPDSGFKVYPGFGSRETQFNTTATSHPLQGPAFIVTPFSPEATLRDTGLPVFPIYAENDDDPMRQWGRDSRLMFRPPADGSYVARIRDARGFQGAEHKYELLIRNPVPDFSVDKGGDDLAIHGGTGRELSFTATRLDGFTGPIEIFAEQLPAGFSLSDPVIIQDEQRQAFAIVIAAADAVQPADEAVAAIRFKARAMINGREVVHEIGGLKSLKIVEKPKIRVAIMSADQHAAGVTQHTPELTVYAGETTRAFLRVERIDHTGLVEFGKEDSGRNMPHGVFVDNIGLNGLMLLDGQTEREFFITTAKWVPESSRPFYLKSSIDGLTTLPVMLHVRHRESPQTAAR